MTVLSRYTTAPLLTARIEGSDSTIITTDLGITESEVGLGESGIRLPDGQSLAWESVEEIASSDSACFLVENNRAERIQVFSEEFQRFYSLYPTAGPPTMMAAGFPMHRIKEIDPIKDTLLKVRAISPIFGDALDTCTGLGYTAIAMARTATRVTTIELDPAVHQICRRNPWSQELFSNPRIDRLIGSSYETIKEMEEESFARVIHDPPTIQLAGELYSGEMYRSLYRVLKRGGRLFHYIGNPKSPRVRSTSQGVSRRLQEVGFIKITPQPEAFGLMAVK
jgi:predicted methyltransferase